MALHYYKRKPSNICFSWYEHSPNHTEQELITPTRFLPATRNIIVRTTRFVKGRSHIYMDFTITSAATTAVSHDQEDADPLIPNHSFAMKSTITHSPPVEFQRCLPNEEVETCTASGRSPLDALEEIIPSHSTETAEMETLISKCSSW